MANSGISGNSGNSGVVPSGAGGGPAPPIVGLDFSLLENSMYLGTYPGSGAL